MANESHVMLPTDAGVQEGIQRGTDDPREGGRVQGEGLGRDLVVKISDFGHARANGRRKRGFPRVQRIGELSNIA